MSASPGEDKMKILELKSSNIKRLKAVELQVDDKQNIVMITGRNGQGKSSVLDSIWYALGGAKVVPEQPIRKGEEKAEVTLDLGDFIVSRSFTEKGSYLKVENKDGAVYKNPQQLLDSIIGRLSFDPLEFSRMEPKKQIQQLIQLTGLDFSDLSEANKRLSEERTFVGREIKALGEINSEELSKAANLANLPEVSVAELSKQLQSAQHDLDQYHQNRRDIEANKNQIKNLKEQVQHLELTIATLEEKTVKLEEMGQPNDNILELQTKLDNAEAENAEIRKAKEIIAKAGVIAEKQTKYDSLSSELTALGVTREERLKMAKMPIEGLAWTETAIIYHDIPFDQLSSAEQLKISMAMAMVVNPKLRLILIRDGSLLDADNLKIIQEMAKDLDFQVWVESVSDDKKVGIVIEDGEIATNNYQK